MFLVVRFLLLYFILRIDSYDVHDYCFHSQKGRLFVVLTSEGSDESVRLCVVARFYVLLVIVAAAVDTVVDTVHEIIRCFC